MHVRRLVQGLADVPALGRMLPHDELRVVRGILRGSAKHIDRTARVPVAQGELGIARKLGPYTLCYGIPAVRSMCGATTLGPGRWLAPA